MSITLKQLEAFVWIADLGSFRAAAERLHTTQPNISARIATLEAALGVTLMARDAGSVRLSSKGRDLLIHARAVLRQTEALIDAAGQTALYDSTLRLGVTELVAETWLGSFLRTFRAAYPNMAVEVTLDMSARLSQELFSHRIDLALQNGPFDTAASGSVALGRYPLIWVAAPALDLPKGRLSAADLARHPVLTHARGTRPHMEVAEHFRDARETVRLVPSSNLAAGKRMTIDGMGLAALPHAMVERELAEGALVALDYDWSPEPLDFSARYDAETCASYVVRGAAIARDVCGGQGLQDQIELS